jgi:hypothetical protein
VIGQEGTIMRDEDNVLTRELTCKLSTEERDNKSAELVRLELDEAQKKADKKAEVAVMNGDLKLIRSRIDKLCKELNEGEETREVPVKAVFRYQERKVDYVRTDTNEVVSSRDMDNYDLEQALPFGDGVDLPAPKKPQKRKRKHGELTDAGDA